MIAGDRRTRARAAIGILALLAVFVVLATLLTGPSDLKPSVIPGLLHQFLLGEPDETSVDYLMFSNIRLPRTVLGFSVGQRSQSRVP